MKLLLLAFVCLASPAFAQRPVPCSGGVVALTYDDGPEPQTNLLLDQLKLFKLKATFFLIGSNVQLYPAIAQRIVTEGHQVGNHTWTHPDLTTLTDAQVLNELQWTQDIIMQTTGVMSKFARPPYGAVDARVEGLMAQKHLSKVIWSRDSGDWAGASTTYILNTLTVVPSGGSLLMHSRMPNSTAAVSGIAWYFTTFWKQTPVCAGRLEVGTTVMPTLDWYGMFSYVHARLW